MMAEKKSDKKPEDGPDQDQSMREEDVVLIPILVGKKPDNVAPLDNGFDENLESERDEAAITMQFDTFRLNQFADAREKIQKAEGNEHDLMIIK